MFHWKAMKPEPNVRLWENLPFLKLIIDHISFITHAHMKLALIDVIREISHIHVNMCGKTSSSFDKMI